MLKKFSISAIQYQFSKNPYDTFTNLEKLFQIAGERKSKFVLLPEMFATGFNYDLFEDFSKHSIELLKYLQQIAHQNNFYIIAGSLPVKANQDTKFFNRSYLISDQGAVMGSYDKNHIFFQNNEDQNFISGKEAKIFHTDLANIGIQICFDIRFPETIRQLTRSGMQILFVPAQFPNPRKDHWKTLLRARAIENQIYVIAANGLGEINPDLSYFGNSMIINPYGEIIENSYEKEGIITAEIDLDFQAAYRKSFPVLNWL